MTRLGPRSAALLCFLVGGCPDGNVDEPFAGTTTGVATSESTGGESDSGSTSGEDAMCPALLDYAQTLGDAGYSGVLFVERDDRVLLQWAGGECIRDSGTPCTTDSVFDIGSLTKQFTAAAILSLQEDDLLSVDDTLAAHFDDVPADKSDITIHQLLTHTAGFEGALGPDYDPVDRDTFIALAFDSSLVFPPGEGYGYSNVGYSILAAIVEEVTGNGYEQVLADRLFDVVGMTQTGYLLPIYDEGVVAHGYMGEAGMGAPNEQPWAPDGPYWHLRGNGGVLSSLPDLRTWVHALFGGLVLSSASTEAMFTPWADEGGGNSYYGYGWVVFDLAGYGTVVTHNGGNDFFYAEIARVEESGITIIVLNNAYDEAWDDIVSELGAFTLTSCE